MCVQCPFESSFFSVILNFFASVLSFISCNCLSEISSYRLGSVSRSLLSIRSAIFCPYFVWILSILLKVYHDCCSNSSGLTYLPCLPILIRVFYNATRRKCVIIRLVQSISSVLTIITVCLRVSTT